jgi:hypothetical protein
MHTRDIRHVEDYSFPDTDRDAIKTVILFEKMIDINVAFCGGRSPVKQEVIYDRAKRTFHVRRWSDFTDHPELAA